MGIFSRHPRDGPVAPNTTTTTTTGTGHGFFGRRAHDTTGTHTVHEKRGPMILSMSKRPSFGQWLKASWIDILTMAAMGMIGLGVSTSSSSFPR